MFLKKKHFEIFFLNFEGRNYILISPNFVQSTPLNSISQVHFLVEGSHVPTLLHEESLPPLFPSSVILKSNLTEEILSITAGSDRGSYAKPLFVQALSSHSRLCESELSS